MMLECWAATTQSFPHPHFRYVQLSLTLQAWELRMEKSAEKWGPEAEAKPFEQK